MRRGKKQKAKVISRGGVVTSAVFRLVVIVLAVVLPLNLLTLILGNAVISEVENQVSLETQNALQMFVAQADNAMDRISVEMYMLAHNNVDYLQLTREKTDDPDNYYDRLDSIVQLRNTIDDILDDHSLIDGLFVYFPGEDYFIREGRTQKQNNAVVEYVRGNISDVQKKDVRRWRMVQLPAGSFLVLIAQHDTGYYGAWISLEAMASRVGSFYDGEHALSAFTDREGRVFLSNPVRMVQLDIDATRLYQDGNRYTLVKALSESSPLCFVQILSKSQLTQALPAAIRILQILSIAAVLIIPVIAIAIQRWVQRPVGMLIHAMERIEQGDVHYRIPKTKVGSEFDRINTCFNHMMDEVSELKIQMYEQQLKAEKTRLGFLSQQIQPHFILNALNILYSYEPEEYKLSRTMILCLSKYFRYVVNANADYVELGQELEHIRNYFGIQQARYLRAFRAQVLCDTSLAGCLIPPLIVQNFTENAIKHALIPGQMVDITVRVWRTEAGKLHIQISDSGPGIPENVMEKIQAFQRTRVFRQDLGVGIQNAIDRLEIIYGEQASLEIGRLDTAGTRVDIELPIQTRGSMSDECDPDR